MFFILCSLFFIIFLILCGVVIIKCQSANFEGCEYICCLLYTSDAADERSSVDLGGRRIIKKKKSSNNGGTDRITHKKKN